MIYKCLWPVFFPVAFFGVTLSVLGDEKSKDPENVSLEGVSQGDADPFAGGIGQGGR